MKIFRSLVLLASVCVLATGCLRVSARHYTNENPKGERGFVAYRAIPHLLVRQTGNKDAPVAVETVYLPDSEERTVVRVRGLFGSAEMNFTLNGDMLSSFNSKEDTKTAETITGLGALATPFTGLAGAAITAGGSVISAGETAAASAFGDLLTFATPLVSALRLRDKSPAPTDTKGLFCACMQETSARLSTFEATLTSTEERAKAKDIREDLASLLPMAQTIDYKQVEDVLVLRRHISGVEKAFDGVFTDNPLFTSEQKEARLAAREGFTKLSQMFDRLLLSLLKQVDTPFQLYRIESKDGATDLTRVWPVPADTTTKP